MSKAVVPFRRELRLGSKGSDVIAVKRALDRLGAFQTGKPISPEYGPVLKEAMRKWQHKHGITGGDGSYGRRTHTALVKRKAFDAYGAWLMQTAEWKTPEEKRRAAIVAEALFLVSKRDGIGYTQGAGRWVGIDREILPPDYPRMGDCSSIATYCYWVANEKIGGVPDPNGLNYRAGFTGTMKANGRVVVEPEPGDLVLWGPGSGRHVAVYVGAGKCVSHGSSSGPLLLPVSYRSDFRQFRQYL